METINKSNIGMKIEIEAYQVVEKIVKSGGNSGRVYVPADWIGKRVKILLMEPIVHDENTKDKN